MNSLELTYVQGLDLEAWNCAGIGVLLSIRAGSSRLFQVILNKRGIHRGKTSSYRGTVRAHPVIQTTNVVHSKKVTYLVHESSSKLVISLGTGRINFNVTLAG